MKKKIISLTLCVIMVMMMIPSISIAAETETNIASTKIVAAVSTSYCSSWESVSALNNGYDPANSADHSHSAYGNWPETATQWVQYEWKWPMDIRKSEVYWYADNDGIYLPTSSKLQYWNGTEFVDVPSTAGNGVSGDKYNTTTFPTITSTKFRLLFNSDGTHSTGILEWKVNGEVSDKAFQKEMNIALSAKSDTSYSSKSDSVTAINDGMKIISSEDRANGIYSADKKVSEQWVRYIWEVPVKINKFEVYWFADKKIVTPASYKVQYWNGTEFTDVPNAVGYGVELDKYNVTTFDEIQTTQLRLVFKSPEKNTSGIIEWKAYGVPVPIAPPSGTNAFYKKYVSVYGLPIMSSEKASDQALINAYFTLQAELKKINMEKRYIIDKMIKNNARVLIVAKSENNYNLPELKDENPTTRASYASYDYGCAMLEDDLVVSKSSSWLMNFNVLSHEYAHVIQMLGIGDDEGRGADPELSKKIYDAYAEVVSPNASYCRYKLESTYDLNNVHEYFAGQVPRWFNCNPVNLNVPNAEQKTDREQLKLYDPTIYNVLESIFGDYEMPAPWNY